MPVSAKRHDYYHQPRAGVIRLDYLINRIFIFRWRQLIFTFLNKSEADAIAHNVSHILLYTRSTLMSFSSDITFGFHACVRTVFCINIHLMS